MCYILLWEFKSFKNEIWQPSRHSCIENAILSFNCSMAKLKNLDMIYFILLHIKTKTLHIPGFEVDLFSWNTIKISSLTWGWTMALIQTSSLILHYDSNNGIHCSSLGSILHCPPPSLKAQRSNIGLIWLDLIIMIAIL